MDPCVGAASEAGVRVLSSTKVTSIGPAANGDERHDGFFIKFVTKHPIEGEELAALGIEKTAEEGNDASIVASSQAAGKAVACYLRCDYVLQATGASREGYKWAEILGHHVSSPVPSLFTLTVRDVRRVRQPFEALLHTACKSLYQPAHSAC